MKEGTTYLVDISRAKTVRKQRKQCENHEKIVRHIQRVFRKQSENNEIENSEKTLRKLNSEKVRK